MLWIKRNLFLVIGGLLAVLLLVGGVLYFLSAKSKNAELEDQLEKTKADLTRIYNLDPFPSATNIDTAKREAEKLRVAVAQAQKTFVPVPTEKVTGLAFRTFRDNTLAELQKMAEQARTTLPMAGYAFSFQAQKTKTEFAPGTFPAIPQQLAEVKALCKILFDAHVNPLVNLRRSRVSEDDRASPNVTDYHPLPVESNEINGTVISPYEVTFHGLSADLAAVLEGFIKSPHGFVVKAIHVEPAPEFAGRDGINQPPPRDPNQPNPPFRRAAPPGSPAAVRPAPPVAPGGAIRPSADKPIVLLKERRLKVTLLIYAIKALK